MRTFVSFLFVGFLASWTVAAPVPKEQQTTAELLVGIWKLTKTDEPLPEGMEASVEFTKDGTLILTVLQDGKAFTTIKGTFKADAEKITYTIKSGDTERSEVLTIKKFMGDDLVVIDPQEKSETFARVKPKPKQEK